MVDSLDGLGISAGDATEVRAITAPAEGDDYISSYYKILRAVEQNTVYFRDDAADLPEPGYGSLVGIAPSTSDETDRETLHVYDGATWVDTFKSVDEVAEDLQEQIDTNETNISNNSADIGDVSQFSAEDVSSQVSINQDNIGAVPDGTNLQEQVDTNETNISNNADDIGDVAWWDDDLQTQIDDLDDSTGTIEDDIDDIEDDIDDIESDIGDVDWWDDDLQTQIDNIEGDVDNIEDDIDDIEDDIGNVSWWDDDLQTQINDIENDINDVNEISDLKSGHEYVGRIKADDLDEDMHDGRNGYVTWDLKDEAWDFDSSNTLVFASIETQPWTSIEHYYGGVITTSSFSSGSVTGFFIMNWDSEVKVSISYLYY